MEPNIKLFCSFLQNIQDTNNIQYEHLYNIKNQKLDQIQINTLDRILRNKNYTLSNYNNTNNIVKCCPHCNYPCYGNALTKKIICEYNKGGCGNDWCFDCNKKLCKNWSKNALYNPNNNFHDNECCKKHAKKENEDYYSMYCLCYK